ncbi:hypothetical protein ACH5RR_035988 [Cinchona calisaya]|uniref:Uncharacterized protein n=1 Tax=Cinchona calisaya TaxID=153742 RepID=A0ABD2Y1W4_9GENT
MAPTMNGHLIIYYSNARNSNKNQSLENSLANILPQFYPLAGRYIKESRTIDCNDEGAEYLEAQVDCRLDDEQILGQEMKPEQLNCLLPCEFGAADEFNDPILSVQVNMFECGGMAIGFSISHRISDVTTATTFLNSWANACFGKGRENEIIPCFNSPLYFPGRNIPKLELGIPRTINDQVFGGPKIVTKRFVFTREAILNIRSKMVNYTGSRVHLVEGIILRVFLEIARQKHSGRSTTALILQPVDFRDKTVPPFPNHSCGNLCIFAAAHLINDANLELERCVNLLSNAVRETIADCAKILNSGEDGNMILINSFNKVTELLYKSEDLNAIILNSWCRKPFYEADFGWGKPVWVSLASLPATNSAILVDTKEGDGIEAWVTLEEKDMSVFQLYQDIKTITT